MQYTLRSKHQQHDTVVKILAPDSPSNITRVVYVLPCSPQVTYRWGDGLDTFLRHDLHNRHQVAAVAPYFADWPWMADHPSDPGTQQVRYLLEDVLPLVDALFPQASRQLLGMSKSGTGSLQLLLRYPDLFASAAVFDLPMMKTSPDQWEMPDFWGSDEYYEPYAIPLLLEERCAQFRDRPRIALFGHGFFGKDHPDWTIDHITAGHQLMERLGIPHIYDHDTWYEHRWDSGWMGKAVAALDEMHLGADS